MKYLHAIMFIVVPLLVFSQKGMQVKSGFLKIHNGSIVEVATSDGNVNMAAAGTIQNDGKLIVDGNWNNAGTLNANTGTILCAGNYTSSGTQNEFSSMVELNGASNQVVSGSDLTFHDLKVNNTAGDVNLSDNASVNGTVTLSSGDLIISTAKTLSFDDTDDPGISGGSASSHIVTVGTGIVQDVYSSMVKITYPLGNGSNYRPVSLTPTAADPETWTLSYTPTAYSDLDVDLGLDHVSTEEYWNINRIGTVDAQLELTWGAFNAVNEYDKLLLAHYDGSNWDLIAANVAGDNISGVITSAAPVTSFSPFTLASSTSSNPLPIELVFFDGYYQYDKNAVILNWSTASELNNDYFTIEKSSNLIEWSAVSKVQGAGNSHVMTYYQSLDKNVREGVIYYRLKQSDFNGTTNYTNAIMVRVPDLVKQPEEITISPNPTDRFVSIDIVGEGYIQIMDHSGQIIMTKAINENERRVDMQGYAKGVYLLAIKTINGVYCSQLILE